MNVPLSFLKAPVPERYIGNNAIGETRSMQERKASECYTSQALLQSCRGLWSFLVVRLVTCNVFYSLSTHSPRPLIDDSTNGEATGTRTTIIIIISPASAFI
eukprot:scaffold101089_cov47-Attheya_sp.AAC.1